MKNKPNPLKVFNDSKENAYKKAGGAMNNFKSNLKKYQGDKEGSEVTENINKDLQDAYDKINFDRVKAGTMLRVINPKEDFIWKKKALDLWREGEKVKPPTGKPIEYDKFKKGGSPKSKKK